MREGRRTALVTGASSGIGLEMARHLANDGCNLVVVSRNGRKLGEVAQDFGQRYQVSVRSHAADLSEPGAAPALWSKLGGAGVGVDILVNNAGVGLYGPFLEQAPDALARMLELNVGTLTKLTRLALAGMRERAWGRILNVACGRRLPAGGPRSAAYYATGARPLLRRACGRLRGAGVAFHGRVSRAHETFFEMKSGAHETFYRWLPTMAPDAVARAACAGCGGKRGS